MSTQPNRKDNRLASIVWVVSVLVLVASLVFLVVAIKLSYNSTVTAPMNKLGADISLSATELPGHDTFCNEVELYGLVNFFPQSTDVRIINKTDATQDVLVLMEGSFVDHDTLFEGELPAGDDVTVELNLSSTVSNWRSALNAIEEPRRAAVCAIVWE